MDTLNKNQFIKNVSETFSQMYDNLENLDTLILNQINSQNTVLVIVDVINGFIREGALHSKRIESIIKPVTELIKQCNIKGIKVIAFADCHSNNATEFNSFPKHCIIGESESEIVDEIKEIGGYALIPKNSTNGFHAPEFQNFLNTNSNINNFIVCGDCTDICVMNFCLTLKTFFDQQNQAVNITVPINMVETYDLGVHQADLMNITALQLMQNAGVMLVKGVE